MRWPFSEKADAKKQKAREQESRGAEEKTTIVRCPLCGKEFHAGEAMQCSACALAVRCGLVMCPNCTYEFPM